MNASYKDVNLVWLAQSKLKRRQFDACIELCTTLLERNAFDQAVWYLKCRALTLKNWIDDTELEEEGIADIMLDENNVAQVARPGTSLARPKTGAAAGAGMNQAVRPMTGSGRPVTGFLRPGTSARPGTGAAKPGTRGGTASLESAMKGNRPGTTRPVTSSGRFVRLGTASMASEQGGPFIAVDRLDLRKYASRPNLARVLCDYMLYVDRSAKRALELAALATAAVNYQDWWWKARLGKCYYQLGLLRDAERQFLSSLGNQTMVVTRLELCKIYLRLDQPNAAVQQYEAGQELHPGDISLLLCTARVHDALGDTDAGLELYKRVLAVDATSIEAIACLASYHFYADQPELALRYYRRLLQMGVSNAEIWNNLGLCCFYASQYDMTLNCFERALAVAGDASAADIWYNISQVAIGIGDLSLAQQCLKIAISLDSNHAEAYNNLGVLECRKGNDQAARALFRSGQRMAEHVFELHFNGALGAFKAGDFQEAHELVGAALAAYPEHTESLELKKQLHAALTTL